jgi:lipopolysaccharide cholinephosphotransferase
MNNREIQLVELNILKQLLPVFEKYQIKYYIMYGTLLGAVRHQGFIPWDDDIDIGVPRNDYERLIDLPQDALPSYLRIRHHRLDERYVRPQIKIEDTRYRICREIQLSDESYIWIDIWPMDGLPHDKIRRQAHLYHLFFWRALFAISFSKRVNINKTRLPILKKVFQNCMSIISNILNINTGKALEKIETVLKECNNIGTSYILSFYSRFKIKDVFPLDFYGEGIQYKFEDMELIGPNNYDGILKKLYGNYMNIPPKYQMMGHFIRKDEEKK